MKAPLMLFFFLLLFGQAARSQENLSTVFSLKTEAPTVKKLKLSNGISLEYAEQGRRGGKTILLLHGYTDSWKSWSSVMPFLPGDVHVLALSQRGHGLSGKPRLGYEPENMAADAALFLQAKKIKSVVVVGHSMGSIIAQRFALDFPRMTEGLVLVGSFAQLKQNDGVAALLHAVNELHDPVDPSFALDFQKSTITRPIPDSFLQMAVAESLKLPASVWKSALTGISNFDYTKTLPRIKARAAIFWGDQDLVSPKQDQELLHRLLPGSVMNVYEGTGHALHWEEPARFAADLLLFIKNIPNDQTR